MNEQEFARLAERYGQIARNRPHAYRWRIAGLAALGYGYIAGALLVLVVGNLALGIALMRMHALGIGAKLIVIQMAVAWAVLRALWVRITPADGIEVTHEQAPALFAALDRVRATIHARRLHRVRVTPDLNAALEQYPRLGIFGWWRNHLLLGLPLLQALRTDEATAVIAHELAHLSRDHGRAGLWGYRAELTWLRIAQSIRTGQNRGAWLFRGFAEWFIPRLQAASLAMSRMFEHEADQLAARAAGVEATARGLARLEVLERHTDEVVWPDYSSQADHQPAPAVGWISCLCRTLPSAETGERGAAWLAERMSEETAPHSTHPSLAERLRALGVDTPPAEVLLPVGRSAADELLGPLAATLEAELDRRWIAAERQGWSQRYQTAQAERARLAELDGGAAASGLPPREALERGYLVAALRDTAEAREIFASVMDTLPEARLAFGRLLLDAGDEAGLAELERAAAEDSALAYVAAMHAAAFFDRLGRTDQAEACHARAAREAAEDNAAIQERRSVTASVQVVPHTLADEQVQTLAAVVAGEPMVRRAWLVRRVVHHRAEIPAHFLVVQMDRWRTGKGARAASDRIASRITVPEVYVAAAEQGKLGKKAARIPSALIHDRKTKLPQHLAAVV